MRETIKYIIITKLKGVNNKLALTVTNYEC